MFVLVDKQKIVRAVFWKRSRNTKIHLIHIKLYLFTPECHWLRIKYCIFQNYLCILWTNMIQSEVPVLGGRNGLEFEQNPEKCALKTYPLMSCPWMPILTVEKENPLKRFYFQTMKSSLNIIQNFIKSWTELIEYCVCWSLGFFLSMTAVHCIK